MKFTIAIPVYNDENTIKQCLDSVIKQTIGKDKLEIICVNDGSTDQSPAILEEYSNTYHFVRVVHQENSGSPSGPRNKAIEIATGDYIFFVDGDDYLGEEALERMEEKVLQYDSDIVVGKYVGINRGVPAAIFRNPDNFSFYGSNAMYTVSVQKLFRVSLLREHNIRFPEHYSLGEDQPFIIQAYAYSNSISIVNDYPCYYLTNNLTVGREQLTKKPITGRLYMHQFEETLAAIQSLNLPREKKLRTYYQYLTRVLNIELRTTIVRSFQMEDKHFIFDSLKALIKQHNYLDIYPNFNTREKLLLRIIEQGELEDLINFWYAERHPGNMQVFHGLVYPKTEKAYELAKAESLSFHRSNKLTAAVTRVQKAAAGLLIEGYHYHSLVDASDEQLYVKLSDRDSDRVISLAVQKGAYQIDSPIPVNPEVMQEQIVSQFHVVIPASVLEELEATKGIVDMHLVSRIENYTAIARILGEFTHHLTAKHVSSRKKSRELTITTYNTKHGNLSLKLQDTAKKKPKQLSRKQRISNKIKRMLKA
ncbi:Glycosyltransferase involved in cell wall bisynthesis [Terribacillus aidingensis]|uniref:Glycosyltransferase involved in cell wall bisynthesis n=1 Tax=Terribacillus aidingensis TaxID=586416 RepID=A0A285N5P5_9BACI|nr:glycosyltransferase family 2 protein [Terribacillus aidingensis]SNZ04648.1 Glycosyltransferase involved in cell wall bisynthesis [Terribacillus aidingensis]